MKLNRLSGPPAVIYTLLLTTLIQLPVQAQGVVDAICGPTPIAAETTPPALYPVGNKDVCRECNYTGQPPMTPYKIDGTYTYQINKDHNGRPSRHARTKAKEMRATAISPTHYADHDGHQLIDVPPRHFFYIQCHVLQADVKSLVTSTLAGVDQLLKRKSDGKSVGKNWGNAVMFDLIKCYWRTINRPSAYFSPGFLTLGSFVAGVVSWGALNIAMEATNTEAFYTDYREMHENVYQGLQSAIHHTNRSGVRVICSNCHVSYTWASKIARKMQASKEVWGGIFGTIDTREKFEAHRLEPVQYERDRLKINNSLGHRNCHNYESMDLTRQSPRASTMHTQYPNSKERTCVDCHKGIAYHLPDISKIKTE